MLSLALLAARLLGRLFLFGRGFIRAGFDGLFLGFAEDVFPVLAELRAGAGTNDRTAHVLGFRCKRNVARSGDRPQLHVVRQPRA